MPNLHGLEIIVTTDDAQSSTDDNHEVFLYYPVDDNTAQNPFKLVKIHQQNQSVFDFGAVLYTQITGLDPCEPEIMGTIHRI